MEPVLLTSFPVSSYEWALRRKRKANSHKVKLQVMGTEARLAACPV
jgi:hypothetical protein